MTTYIFTSMLIFLIINPPCKYRNNSTSNKVMDRFVIKGGATIKNVDKKHSFTRPWYYVIQI